MTNAAATLELPRRRRDDRTAWVGLFTLLGLFALLALLFTLTSPAMFRGRYVVHGWVKDAHGLRRGNAVQMRGVAIGEVGRFSIGPEGVRVDMKIDGHYSIPSDSRLVLASSGLLGDEVVEVLPGRSPTPLASGATLPSAEEAKGDTLGSVGKVAEQAGEALGRVQALLSDKTVGNVEATTGELPRVLERLEALTRELQKTSATLDRSAQSAGEVLGRVNRGEGTLGRLSRDEELYQNANQAAANLSRAANDLSKLVEDIRQNPKRYINVKIF